MKEKTVITGKICGSGTRNGVAVYLAKWPGHLVQLKNAGSYPFYNITGEVEVAFDDNLDPSKICVRTIKLLSDETVFNAFAELDPATEMAL